MQLTKNSAIRNDAVNLPTLTLNVPHNAIMSPFIHDYPHVAREEVRLTVGVVKLAGIRKHWEVRVN